MMGTDGVAPPSRADFRVASCPANFARTHPACPTARGSRAPPLRLGTDEPSALPTGHRKWLLLGQPDTGRRAPTLPGRETGFLADFCARLSRALRPRASRGLRGELLSRLPPTAAPRDVDLGQAGAGEISRR